MTRDEIRQYVLANPMRWRPLSPVQRLQLAVILRPDLPVGIDRRRSETAVVESPPEAA